MSGYRVIFCDNERELVEAVRVGNLLGDIAIGHLIVDGDVVLQVMKHVRDGYVSADGTPITDGSGIRGFFAEAPHAD